MPREKRRRRRGSKLGPYTKYIDVRLSEGLDNLVVLLRQLRTWGYSGGYTILEDFVHHAVPLHKTKFGAIYLTRACGISCHPAQVA